MALGIAVAFNNDANSPGITSSLSGLTGFDQYRVVRKDQGPNESGGVLLDAPVRGADLIDVITDAINVTDYETPINAPSRYTLEGYVAGALTSSVTSGTIFVDPNDPVFLPGFNRFWIKNIPNPSLSRAVMLVDFSTLSYNATILSNNKVLGRKNPVIFTDVWGSRSGPLGVLCIDYLGNRQSVADLEALFTSGDVLLIQTAFQPYVLKDMYCIVWGMDRTQYTAPSFEAELDFTFSLDVDEVDRPVTRNVIFGLGTWDDLKNDPTLTTWQDVFNTFDTWADVLNNYTS